MHEPDPARLKSGPAGPKKAINIRRRHDALAHLAAHAHSHLGDGNLHYNLQCPEGGDAKRFLAEHEHEVSRIVFDALVPFGGSFSAEHGIGALKRDELAARKSPVALALMRRIKAALDPRNTLNPGRVI